MYAIRSYYGVDVSIPVIVVLRVTPMFVPLGPRLRGDDENAPGHESGTWCQLTGSPPATGRGAKMTLGITAGSP